MGKCNCVHLRAMINKNMLIMKADKKKTIFEIVFIIFYSYIIGYSVSSSFKN